ncbi:MAG: Na+/H+ antiporter subunit E [Halomonas sp.]|uniref:Na+/H+ antiporter subunit E n=1 Tax=Halomonas sp. TaxID=1486246 RepID=UPI003F8FAC1D
MSLHRWLPSPMLSAALLAMWLMLNQSVAPAQILLGSLLAIAAPLMTKPLRPMTPVPFRKPLVMARLLTLSLIEIIRSCFNVSRIILLTKPQGLNSQFIKVPLDLKHSHGLALLSCLINSTPGTVWVEILPDTHDLVLHVFDLHDAQWWVDTIKTRYEKPLIEIFDNV